MPQLRPVIEGMIADLEAHLDDNRRGERLRDGIHVAVIGAPNAGKSTLVNALAQRDVAIVSDLAGTTRDVIEVRMDLGGLAVTVLDTAGLREASDQIEQIGIEVARERAEAADIRVFLCEDVEGLGVGFQRGDLHVFPKGDLRVQEGFSVSGLTGVGVDRLVSALSAELSDRVPQAGLATRERHKRCMEAALSGLTEAREFLDQGAVAYDLTAESLRHAVVSLEALIGKVDVENLLDEIFSSFCLGK